jgi:hypothetical protein
MTYQQAVRALKRDYFKGYITFKEYLALLELAR